MDDDMTLFEFVNDPEATITAFAPTDDAFAELSLISGDVDVKDVLLFHAVLGTTIYAKDLSCERGGDRNLIQMANGENSRTICDFADDITVIYQKGPGNARDNMPMIIAADVEACNGIIHVVDRVMLPNLDDIQGSAKETKGDDDIEESLDVTEDDDNIGNSEDAETSSTTNDIFTPAESLEFFKVSFICIEDYYSNASWIVCILFYGERSLPS